MRHTFYEHNMPTISGELTRLNELAEKIGAALKKSTAAKLRRTLMGGIRLKRGMVARYVGTVHAFMTGLKVKLNEPILGDDGQPTGLWDVAPWIEEDQRFSWVTSDARCEDLLPLGEDGNPLN